MAQHELMPSKTQRLALTTHQAADSALLLQALEQSAGPCLVLDKSLRIVAGSDAVVELLGMPIPVGSRAPQVLCGQGQRRPVAEALARGESASTEIVRTLASGEQVLAIKTTPLLQGEKIVGHLLMLTSLGPASQGVSELHGILTRSESMRSLLRIVKKVAVSDASVLVRGETGSGKELIARALHALSPRKCGPFAAINCAALPPELLESELFGHVRGAFTGAVKEHVGHLRAADGGTLFLDEVAELPLAVQAKLLRVTQERSVLPVGGSKAIAVDVRIISATHRSLREEVAAGRFRADLMYRLRVIPLFLPPLRERPGDIELLVEHCVKKLNAAHQSRHLTQVAPAAMELLKSYSWPGNVRELQNVMHYAFLLGEGPVLSALELPRELREPAMDTDAAYLLPKKREQSASGAVCDPPADLPEEAVQILHALRQSSGNRTQAADSLGISRSTLWRRMQKYQLDVD